MIRRSLLLVSLISALLVGSSPAEAWNPVKAVTKVTKVLEKAVQDAGKTTEKAAQDAGKTSEKAGRDTWNELTRDRKDGENIQMDFSNVTSGPVEGVHYSLVHENGSGVVVFLRPCVLTVVDSNHGKVTSMLPIPGRAGDRLVLKVNQGIRTEW